MGTVAVVMAAAAGGAAAAAAAAAVESAGGSPVPKPNPGAAAASAGGARAEWRSASRVFRAAGGVELMVYDNRIRSQQAAAFAEPTQLLLRSANELGLPVRVGSLHSEVNQSEPKPYAIGDRETWLDQQLPRGKNPKLVYHLDGNDVLLLCGAAELERKHARLTEGRDALVMSAEIGMWPEDMQWNDQYLCGAGATLAKCMGQRACCSTDLYPRSDTLTPSASYLRWANAGAILGPPATYRRMLKCMRERYPGFPYQCPMNRHPNGSYTFVRSNESFQTRRLLGLATGEWGWDQACYHMYLMEQHQGLLPHQCPPVVLDFNGSLALPLNKVSNLLKFGRNKRALFTPTGETPCALHANGPAKYMLAVLQWWWDRKPEVEVPQFADWPKMRDLWRFTPGVIMHSANRAVSLMQLDKKSSYTYIEPYVQ